MTDNSFKTFLITLLSLTLLFLASCSNEGTTGGGGGGSGKFNDIPTASGNNATVGNAEFTGNITNKSLVGDGWTEETVNNMITPFTLDILENKVYGGLTMKSGKQLLCSDGSNPNVVEASEELVLEDGTTYKEYIKMTLDNANSPTKADIIYYIGMYIPGYSAHPSMSDTVVAVYDGTLTKK